MHGVSDKADEAPWTSTVLVGCTQDPSKSSESLMKAPPYLGTRGKARHAPPHNTDDPCARQAICSTHVPVGRSRETYLQPQLRPQGDRVMGRPSDEQVQLAAEQFAMRGAQEQLVGWQPGTSVLERLMILPGRTLPLSVQHTEG